MGSPLDNLVPFPKGGVGNPDGRQKGSKNRSTIAKQILGLAKALTPNEINQIQSKYGFSVEELQIETLIMMKQADRATELGDTKSAEFLMNQAYPPHKQTVEQYTSDEIKKIRAYLNGNDYEIEEDKTDETPSQVSDFDNTDG